MPVNLSFYLPLTVVTFTY